MRRYLPLILILISACTWARAETAQTPSFQNLPIEINATGATNYNNGIATANDNVAIHVGDTDIYADHARYDSHTHLVEVDGNVRIYRAVHLFIGERAVYNVDTKEIQADNMRGEYQPYFVAGKHISVLSNNQTIVQNGTFTTSDEADPSFHLAAHTVRIYEGDRVIFQNVTLYIGKVPVFWWPYLYQSLDDAFSFSVAPAYLSSWGPSLLTQVTFPITKDIHGRVRLDYRARRGEAIGFEADMKYGEDKKSFANLRTYFLEDQNPLLNQTTLPRGEIGTSRYRLTLQDLTYFTDDIYGIANITKLSDAYVLQDFYQTEFQLDPNPDNVVALTKSDPFYTLSAVTRFQANGFFDTTERLPEVSLDIKRHALFGGPIYYEGESSIGEFRRNFATGSGFEDYGTLRADTFHQLLYPNTYFGWLSIVPRVGFRATYYGDTRDLGKTVFTPDDNPLVPDFLLPDPTIAEPIPKGGDTVRTVINAGTEASFKFSREWEDVQSRFLGLDGLRHIVQPFTDFSYVSSSGDPASILQFDRYEPSTQLRPIDFPQYTSIDSIDDWTIWRVGVRNRLQTRRDDLTISWLEVETYLDINIDNPFDRTPYSNFFNNIRFTPVPWASLSVDSQLPVFDKGFTEIDTVLSVQPISRLQLLVSHRYLQNNPFFLDSSLFVVGGYYRLDDNWGIGAEEQYEEETHTLELQRYSLYRDLSSWVASFGAIIRDNGGVKEYGVLLTFTLKAFPKVSFDLNYDPGGAGGTTQ